MTISRYNRSTMVFFWLTLGILIACIVLLAIYSSFRHVIGKFQFLFSTVILTLLLIYLLGDPIKFTLIAIDRALWPEKQHYLYKKDQDVKRHTHLDYLKLKLRTAKSHLLISEWHRDEPTNESYRHITHDLWLYGKYFFFLLCIILVTWSSLFYYNTYFLMNTFYHNYTNNYGLEGVIFWNDLKSFINTALVLPFNKILESGEVGWEHAAQARILGVVRLRQLYKHDTFIELKPADFSNINMMPGWKEPYVDQNYRSMYWRVYEPWIPRDINNNWLESLLFSGSEKGDFDDYPQATGYTTTFARNATISETILDYLMDSGWFSKHSAVIHFDFTLYNPDANVFSIITLRVERTPYGVLLTSADIQSIRLLSNIENMEWYQLILLMLYVLVVIQFTRTLVLKIWFDRTALQSHWNRIDLIICILNLILLMLFVLVDQTVSAMVHTVSQSSKLEFIDFRMPANLYFLLTIVLGILVAITTMRLWKTLQFASVFKLFTHTLFKAWKALLSTAMAIVIFLIGLGFAMDTMNGNNSFSFNTVIKAIITCVSFTFGIHSNLRPDTVFFGGMVPGIVAYIILVFVIVILLMNVFVSLINDYFTTAKSDFAQRMRNRMSYIQFLRVEYADKMQRFCYFHCCRNPYRSKGKSVKENINRQLDIDEEHEEEQKRMRPLQYDKVKQENEILVERRFRCRLEKTYGLSVILEAQMDILKELLFQGADEEQYMEMTEQEMLGIAEREIRMKQMEQKKK